MGTSKQPYKFAEANQRTTNLQLYSYYKRLRIPYVCESFLELFLNSIYSNLLFLKQITTFVHIRMNKLSKHVSRVRSQYANRRRKCHCRTNIKELQRDTKRFIFVAQAIVTLTRHPVLANAPRTYNACCVPNERNSCKARMKRPIMRAHSWCICQIWTHLQRTTWKCAQGC